jgi:hypothetical protein
MDASRTSSIQPTTVWAWDGFWWPAVVAKDPVDDNCGSLIVRLENGITVPLSPPRSLSE